MVSVSVDVSEYKPMDEYSLLPPGWYAAAIAATTMDYTNKAKEEGRKDEYYLKLEFHILEGDYKGQKVWTQLNIKNRNQTAMDIANRELRTILESLKLPPNHLVSNDTETMHGKPLSLKIDVDSYKDKHGLDKTKNVVKNYKPYDPSLYTKEFFEAKAEEAGKKSAGGKAPWAK